MPPSLPFYSISFPSFLWNTLLFPVPASRFSLCLKIFHFWVPLVNFSFFVFSFSFCRVAMHFFFRSLHCLCLSLPTFRPFWNPNAFRGRFFVITWLTLTSSSIDSVRHEGSNISTATSLKLLFLLLHQRKVCDSFVVIVPLIEMVCKDTAGCTQLLL